ncbi:hypothetical protein FRC10_011876 [Ceratobasidium sp. 414]|nr:hypothetical protein FRC10_011876 [Ceratobasidium sp. 414]
MNLHQATEEDSICDDLLAIGTCALKLWLLWNALVAITVAIFSMRLEPFLLVLAFSIPPDFTLPTPQRVLHIAAQLPEFYRTLRTLLSRNSSALSQNLSAASDVSTVLANRGSRWSSGKGGAGDGSGPLFITFGDEWGVEDDPPFKWYALQPRTRFKSIDHRRSRESPFFHEFLILKLGDGSCCRLERTGEGSRLDAIRRAGSLAHDIIERVTSDDYERELDETSDIISTIELPEEFDLLDILAICYAVQQGKHSSKYTLQRYNCYFFCCTILVVLARRLLEWERTFTDKAWESTLDTALSELSSRSQTPLSEDSQRYIMPRLCAILDPGNSQPTQFLLDTMRERMDKGADLNEACAQTLWGSRLDKAIDTVLEKGLSGVVERAIGGGGTCPLAVRTIFRFDHKPDIWNQPTCALALTIYSRKFVQTIFDHLDEARAGFSKIGKLVVDEYAESWTEYYSRSCRFLWQLITREVWDLLLDAGSEGGSEGKEANSTLMSKFNLAKRGFRGLWFILALDVRALLALGLETESTSVVNSPSSTLRAVYLSIKSAYQAFLLKIGFFRILLLIRMLQSLSESYGSDLDDLGEDILTLRGIEEPSQLMGNLIALAGEDALVQTLDAIEDTSLFGPDEWRATLTLGALGADNIYDSLGTWWWKFCERSLSRPTLDAIHSGQSQNIILSKIFDSSNSETPGQIPYVSMSILEYQQRIQSRIAAHADRVASTQLGAAELVRQDIEDAMASVWASLPEGHGSRIGNDDEGDDQSNSTASNSTASNSGSANEDVAVDSENGGESDHDGSGDRSDISDGSQ